MKLSVYQTFICVLLFVFGLTVSIRSQTPVPVAQEGGWWLHPEPGGAMQTLIAQFQTPQTYQICRAESALHMPVDPIGVVTAVIDGETLQEDIDPGSCVIVRGKKIGIAADGTYTDYFRYRGIYRKLSAPTLFSEPIKNNFIASRSFSDTNTFLAVAKTPGVYRICHDHAVKDTDLFDIGIWIKVDGEWITHRGGAQDVVRFARGNCVDVEGHSIIRYLPNPEELPRNQDWPFIRFNGTFQYLITTLPK